MATPFFYRFSLLVLIFISANFTLVYGQNNSQAWQAKVHETVFGQLQNKNKVEVVIEFQQQADLSIARSIRGKNEKGTYVFNKLRDSAERDQSKVIEWLKENSIDHRPFYIVNAIYAYCNEEQIESLAKRKEIRKIQYNINLKQSRTLPSDELRSRSPETVEWGIEMINADDVWGLGHTGTGVVVGGQDTGYDWDHEALIEKYRGYDGSSTDHNYNWHDAIHEIDENNTGDNPCGLDSPEPCDDHFHGTHTMGTIVGSAGSIEIGVAPDAQWIGCRNMERGDGTPETYLECFEWFLAPTDLNDENPDPGMAPHVINNSWSCPPVEGCDGSYDFSILETAIHNLQTAGVVVVVSAGNEGPGCSSISNPPAFYSSSFSVGATNSSDEIANFSSRGPTSGYGISTLKPDVSAPGVAVYSAEPGDEYGSHSGTSMAGPHVAGTVALIISAEPSLAGDVDEIENILEQTAVPKTTTQECGGVAGDEIPNNTYGYGRINALAAVNMALGNLPLDILYFKGIFIDKTIVLNWEIDNIEFEEHFEIEKSKDLYSWNSIGEIAIENNATFTFIDHQPFSGQNYYRLRIIDQDGKYRFSKNLKVVANLEIITDLYPNPVSKDYLYLKLKSNSTDLYRIRISGIDGITRIDKKIKFNNEFETRINVNDLKQGLFLLTVHNESGEQLHTFRFIKN